MQRLCMRSYSPLIASFQRAPCQLLVSPARCPLSDTLTRPFPDPKPLSSSAPALVPCPKHCKLEVRLGRRLACVGGRHAWRRAAGAGALMLSEGCAMLPPAASGIWPHTMDLGIQLVGFAAAEGAMRGRGRREMVQVVGAAGPAVPRQVLPPGPSICRIADSPQPRPPFAIGNKPCKRLWRCSTHKSPTLPPVVGPRAPRSPSHSDQHADHGSCCAAQGAGHQYDPRRRGASPALLRAPPAPSPPAQRLPRAARGRCRGQVSARASGAAPPPYHPPAAPCGAAVWRGGRTSNPHAPRALLPPQHA